jgi:hypothetical protein
MIRKVLNAHRRFVLNMARIAGLMKLVMSDEGEFKATGFMTYEGVSADILRLLVVFLHASVEDLVRSQLTGQKRFSFQSGTDIDNTLRRAGFDPSPLKILYRPLTAMAKRRNRIVHGADLVSQSSTEVEPWGVADLWQVLHWNLAVLAFYYQMLIVLTGPHEVFLERYDDARTAMDESIKFAHQLMSFPQGALEFKRKTLEYMSESLRSMLQMLKHDD